MFMHAAVYQYVGLLFLVLLISICPATFLQAQATELDVPPQQCNKDPSKGKLGPVGDPPRTKCVTGDSIKEGKNNSRFFDSLVLIDGLGRPKVCNTPIPLKENCEPARQAIVEYCDDVLKNASGGREGCKKIPKDGNAQSLESIGKMTDHLSESKNRYDYVARGILEASKNNLDKYPAVLYSSVQDPAGILVAFDDAEKSATPYLNNAERRVEGPMDILRSLAGDISPTNPTQLEAAKALVERAEVRDLDPWLLTPRYIEDTSQSYQNKFQDRYTLYSYDSGIEVNYYPKDTPTFTGYEVKPPEGGAPLTKVPNPLTAPSNPIISASTFDPHTRDVNQSISTRSAYSAALSRARDSLYRMWQWIRWW